MIQAGLEMYRNDYGYYPTPLAYNPSGWGATPGFSLPVGCTAELGLNGVYISNIPCDPLDNENGRYRYVSMPGYNAAVKPVNYRLCTVLEKKKVIVTLARLKMYVDIVILMG
jgi:hypothetical protein